VLNAKTPQTPELPVLKCCPRQEQLPAGYQELEQRRCLFDAETARERPSSYRHYRART